MKTSTNAEICLPRMMDVIRPEGGNSPGEQKKRGDSTSNEEKEQEEERERERGGERENKKQREDTHDRDRIGARETCMHGRSIREEGKKKDWHCASPEIARNRERRRISAERFRRVSRHREKSAPSTDECNFSRMPRRRKTASGNRKRDRRIGETLRDGGTRLRPDARAFAKNAALSRSLMIERKRERNRN